ncbi:C40 family peptidase [Solibacillus sp. A46]|uniref:C40 family peptidase n=1 Tax=Solibacillus faecavium TaxID=2762221 RepID=A0ABR8XZ40_9BACL|nr:SH3 domain-containing C40 family peptidase [Solibacillus faecavium]MBD8037195.1 C40 family peptidase [Solibacillus faecavium]
MNAVVKVMIANIHKSTDINTELTDEALYGMPVEVLEDIDDTWVKIRTFYRYEGYTLKTNLHMESEDILTWIDANYVVIQNFADVLTRPKIQSSKIITLTLGAFIQVLKEADLDPAWTKVRLVTGEVGYVRSQWIQKRVKVYTTNELAFREQVVQDAFRYIGTPYRWGGKSPLGIDCSGLVSMAYMLNGAYIYRDAKILDGFPIRKIEKAELKLGDLIMFPGHVAMYIGEDLYIHSSLGGNEVNVNSLNPQHSEYRQDLATTITEYGSIF